MNLEGQPPSQGQARWPEVWLSGAQPPPRWPLEMATQREEPEVEAQPKGCI